MGQPALIVVEELWGYRVTELQSCRIAELQRAIAKSKFDIESLTHNLKL